MKAYKINSTEVNDLEAVKRDSLGGYPILAEDQEWPTCKICQAQMVLFLQFDIRAEFELPFHPNSHLSIFMCPEHNDIPDLGDGSGKLAERYWAENEGHYCLILNPPNIKERVFDTREPHLNYCSLDMEEIEEEIEGTGMSHGKPYDIGTQGFKIGGIPSWAQDPANNTCSCGAVMQFIGQIPENFGFVKTPEAKSQPNSISNNEYGLFLGNEVYIFGCTKQCNPFAVWVEVQN